MTGRPCFNDAAAVHRRLHRLLRHRRAHGRDVRRDPVRPAGSPTRTSSSRTSTIVIFGAAVFPILGGLYYWFPKLTGRMYHERLGPGVVLAHLRRHDAHVLPDAHRRAARHAAARLHLPAGPRLGRAQPGRDGRRVPARRRAAAHRRRTSSWSRCTGRPPGRTRGAATRSSGRRRRRRRATTSPSSRWSQPVPDLGPRRSRGDRARLDARRLVLERGHETPATTVLDAELDEVARDAVGRRRGRSCSPLCLARLFALLLSAHYAARRRLRSALAALALAAWHWQEPPPERARLRVAHARAARARTAGGGWRCSSRPRRRSSAALIASYFYLRFRPAALAAARASPEPKVVLPLVLTGVLVLASVPMALAARRAPRRRGSRGARGARSLALVVQARLLRLPGPRCFSRDLDEFAPQRNAYALDLLHAPRRPSRARRGRAAADALAARATLPRPHAVSLDRRAGDRALLALRQRPRRRRRPRRSFRRAVSEPRASSAALVRPARRRRSRGRCSSSSATADGGRAASAGGARWGLEHRPWEIAADGRRRSSIAAAEPAAAVAFVDARRRRRGERRRRARALPRRRGARLGNGAVPRR